MSRDINSLVPEFKWKVEELLKSCEDSGYPMRPFYTVRSPFEQGKLWRQSRTAQQVEQKLEELYKSGGDFLAHCIESVGPQHGRHVTNAVPGFSWHQWGEAVDCFWLVDDSAEWSTRKQLSGNNGYANYAGIADSLDLDPGGLWSSFKDSPHVQLRKVSHPGKVYSVEEINAVMKSKFGNAPN